MSGWSINRQYQRTGTRFRLFVQSPVSRSFPAPETVWVSSRAGSLLPGPADNRMYVVQARDKPHYGDEDNPPYRGPADPPVAPTAGGHFDHLKPGDPGFAAAHMFGAVRRVMDVWETYFGGAQPWHFQWFHKRLEMIPWVDWDNAHFGWGFMEFGHGGKDGRLDDTAYCLNFDVLAHEVGHSIAYATVGVPQPDRLTTEYRGFHESASDMVALLSALHFESLVEHVLAKFDGDLYVANELNRIGETSETEQIRLASNVMTMDDVIDPSTPAKEATGKQVHALGQPLTGALFDLLVELYQKRLVARGLISAGFADQSRVVETGAPPDSEAQRHVRAAYRRHPQEFAGALREARDMLGRRLARCWHQLDPEDLTYAKVAATLLLADRQISGRKYQKVIADCLQWRGIAVE